MILAGGGAARLGGRDKPALPVAGVSMLDRVLAALAGADLRIVVGPPRPGLPADVVTVREDPPGAGPAAATAAALAVIPPAADALIPPAADGLIPPAADGLAPPAVGASMASGGASDGPAVEGSPVSAGRGLVPSVGGGSGPAALIGVFAADLPHLTAEAVGVLVAAVGDGVDGAVFVDGRGKRQLLCGVWRAAALRGGVERLGDPVGKPMRAVFDGLVVAEVGWERGGVVPYFDCDTDEDLRRAEQQQARRTGAGAPEKRSGDERKR